MHSGIGGQGFIDSITATHVQGWAIDPQRGTAPASVFVFLDGKLAANLLCNEDRPDLSGLVRQTRSIGFRFAIPDAVADGEPHTIEARLATGEYLHIIGDDGMAGPSATIRIPPRPPFLGHVDGVSGGRIKGWAAARQSGSARADQEAAAVRFLHKGTELGRLSPDELRPDVAQALGCSASCGFSFQPPTRLRDGHEYLIDVHFAASGTPIEGSPVHYQAPAEQADTRIAELMTIMDGLTAQLWRLKGELHGLQASGDYRLAEYHPWAVRYQSALRARLAKDPWPADRPQPLVSVLCPVFRPPLPEFKAALASVLAQTYANWELILIDDASRSPELTRIMRDACTADPRIRLVVHAANAGISEATNTGIEAAGGDYVALFDHDDLLEPVAVEMMVATALRRGALVVYSDEDKIDAAGRFSDPNLKPDWNYRLLLAQNYVCHFLLIEAATLRAAGPLRKEYDGAQDHDLVLRLSEAVPADRIVHLPAVIYHWRITPGSTAQTIGAKSYAVGAGMAAVRDHLRRCGHAPKVGGVAGITMYQVDWAVRDEPSVTVVIPFRDQAALTRRCLDAVRRHTRYRNLRVVLVDNWSASPEAAAFTQEAAALPGVHVLRIEEPFNFSRLNNLACAAYPADFFVFMNNDVFVERRDWLRTLVNEALADDDVAVVGAKLVYPDRTVQHGGVILGVCGVGDHANRGRPPDDPFFMGRGLCAQELSAVTGALMLCRGDAFRAVAGFDERDLVVAYNDVDLCLKLRAAGHKVIYCPAVVAEHHESASRGDDMAPMKLGRFIAEERVMLTRWAHEIHHDPFYNPNFSTQGGIFTQLADPVMAAANLAVAP